MGLWQRWRHRRRVRQLEELIRALELLAGPYGDVARRLWDVDYTPAFVAEELRRARAQLEEARGERR